MIFVKNNIRIEFTEEEKEALRKTRSIFYTLLEKMEGIDSASLGVDNVTYFEKDDINCTTEILEVMNKYNIEIILD